MSKKETKSARAGKRLNKKVLVVFLAAVIAVALSSFLGVMTASGARKVSGLTNFDHILYWQKGQRGTVEQNLALGKNAQVKYWQAIEQKYGLGYINSNGLIKRYWSRWNNKTHTAKIEEATSGSTSGPLRSKGVTKKNYNAFIDHLDGGSYMGELYDVREYFWSIQGNVYVQNRYNRKLGARGNDVANAHPNPRDPNQLYDGISDIDDPQSALAVEFHFYPRGTLAPLEELNYTKKEGWVSCDPNVDGTVICVQTRTISIPIVPAPTDPNAPTSTTVPVFEKDIYAYRDESGHVIYTGYYTDKNGNFKYSAKTYQEYLKSAEDSVQQYGENKGEFNGTISFYDIDTRHLERYVPVSGVNSVFTTYNSSERAGKESLSSILKSAVYKERCPNRTKNDICYYSWGGGSEGTPNKLTYRVWFNFTSTSERPFTLIYAGWGHASGFYANNTMIAYVLKDDVNDMPDGVIEAIENFAEEYKNLYGRELREDPFFESHPEVDPDKVIRLFPIFSFSDYDPYHIQNYLENLEDLQGKKLNWYNCSEITPSCKIPDYPAHDKPNIVTGTSFDANGQPVQYINGYDFVKDDKEPKIYWGSLSSYDPINFPNTCYSDNNKPVETGDYDK